MLYSNFWAAIYFTLGRVYILMLLYLYVLLFPSSTVSTSPFSIFMSPLLPSNQVHQCHFSRFHFAIVVQLLCLTLCNHNDCSTPGSPALDYIPSCVQIYPLSWWYYLTISSSSSHSPPAFKFSQHQGLLKWVGSLHQVAKILEQLQYQSFQWIFRVNFL